MKSKEMQLNLFVEKQYQFLSSLFAMKFHLRKK